MQLICKDLHSSCMLFFLLSCKPINAIWRQEAKQACIVRTCTYTAYANCAFISVFRLWEGLLIKEINNACTWDTVFLKRAVLEKIHTSPTEGLFSKTPTLCKFQLNFIHFFKCFSLKQPPHLGKFQFLLLGEYGFWNCTTFFFHAVHMVCLQGGKVIRPCDSVQGIPHA